MSEFSVRVVRISEPVVDHPDADRLSLIKIGGYTCISAKVDGEHRYKVGDLVVYVPEGAIVPEYLLRQGFWDEAKGKGILAGTDGDRVKAIRLRGIFSQGILFPVGISPDVSKEGNYVVLRASHYVQREDKTTFDVEDGTDVAEFLGITKWEPPIPTSMAGEVAYVPSAAFKYDFESIQRVTDLFEAGEEVEATEKLHGTHIGLAYIPGLNHPEMFFDGNLAIWSKGLGAKGLVFKNNEANAGNLYVRIVKQMLDNSLGDRLRALAEQHGTTVRIFGEVHGKGVQDLSYGLPAPIMKAFDVAFDGNFLTPDDTREILHKLEIMHVPVLYRGPYDLDALEIHRDGKDCSGSHIREGIVIRAVSGARHPEHGRKIGKWVSPAYLLRKGGTELQ